MKPIEAAIIGSGNIGCDLMYKILKNDKFHLALLAGIDPASRGLKLADSVGVENSYRGIEAVLDKKDVEIVFDATSAEAHLRHAPLLKDAGKMVIDLTPAAVGPYVVPCVNLSEVKREPNLNMVTCGGQATVPMVYAISRAANIEYAEIVSCIASDSAGIGTRANIDEFTETTAHALMTIGRAESAKAIIVLNPAVPPIYMTNTIYAKVNNCCIRDIEESCNEMLEQIRRYVPGYHYRVPPIINNDIVTVVIEVEGAGDYLPKYAGNLDIITSASTAVAERLMLG